MTVYLVISLPKIPCIHRIYMVLANPIYTSLIWQVVGYMTQHHACTKQSYVQEHFCKL